MFQKILLFPPFWLFISCSFQEALDDQPLRLDIWLLLQFQQQWYHRPSSMEARLLGIGLCFSPIPIQIGLRNTCFGTWFLDNAEWALFSQLYLLWANSRVKLWDLKFNLEGLLIIAIFRRCLNSSTFHWPSGRLSFIDLDIIPRYFVRNHFSCFVEWWVMLI